MGVATVAGRAVSLLGRHFVRFGRVNPWVTVGLTGAAIGTVAYKHKKNEKRINDIIEATFHREISERHLWNDVRSQVAGASKDLFKTYMVHTAGERKPCFHQSHCYKPKKGEIVEEVKGPQVNEACDLVSQALGNLLQSKANEISIYKDNHINKADTLLTRLKRIHIRLQKAKAGDVKKPDYPGIQKQLDRFVEEDIKPLLSDLSYVIDQGAIRVRADFQKGFYRKKKA